MAEAATSAKHTKSLYKFLLRIFPSPCSSAQFTLFGLERLPVFDAHVRSIPGAAAACCARAAGGHATAAPPSQDELATSQFIELHSIPSSQGRIAGYRIGRDQSGLAKRYRRAR